MNYSFDEVMNMDIALQQLAMYEVTRGLIVIPKTPEEYIELQEKIANKFNYFKKLIKNNECTFQYINKSVLEKNGPFPKDKPFNINDIDKMDFKQLEETGVKENDVHDFIDHIIKSLFPDVYKNSTNTPNDLVNKSGIKDVADKLGVKITVLPLDIKSSLSAPFTPSSNSLPDYSKKTKNATPKKIRKKSNTKKD